MENSSKRKHEDETKPSGDQGKNTVCFNVGGRIYEVSRSLLNQYPDTMLARLASDTWSNVQSGDRSDDDSGGNEGAVPIGADDGNRKAFFIERDGDRFRYCLDYMRDGGIAGLPATISKDALLQDLAYFGFHEVDPSAISVEGSLAMLKICHQHIDSLQQKLNKELLVIDRNRRYVELVKLFLDRYKANACLEFLIGKNHKMNATANELINGDKNQFIAHLATVGLKLNTIKHSTFNSSVEFILAIAK